MSTPPITILNTAEADVNPPTLQLASWKREQLNIALFIYRGIIEAILSMGLDYLDSFR
jgi:hypothetical protein